MRGVPISATGGCRFSQIPGVICVCFPPFHLGRYRDIKLSSGTSGGDPFFFSVPLWSLLLRTACRKCDTDVICHECTDIIAPCRPPCGIRDTPWRKRTFMLVKSTHSRLWLEEQRLNNFYDVNDSGSFFPKGKIFSKGKSSMFMTLKRHRIVPLHLVP